MTPWNLSKHNFEDSAVQDVQLSIFTQLMTGEDSKTYFEHRSVQHLTFSTDLFAMPSFICNWVKNSELHQALPFLSFPFTEHAMVLISSAGTSLPLSHSFKTLCMSLECLPNRQKMFPGLVCLPCLLVSSAAFVSGQGSSFARQETYE